MKKTLIASALALAFGTANAAVITFEDNYPPPINEETTEINQSLSLGLFDTTLGTLDSILLTLFGSTTSQANFTNSAPQEQSFQADGTVILTFSNTLGITLSPFPSINLALPYTGGGTVNIAGGGGTFASSILTASDSLAYNIDPSAFSAFSVAGGGTFGLGCGSLSGVTISGGGGNVTSAQTTTAGCGAQVTYNFTEAPPPNGVPEPGSLALLGLGLAGLAGLRRRRQG